MDASCSLLVAPFQQPTLWTQHEDDFWEQDQMLPRTWSDRAGIPPMQRYLQESDHRVYNAPASYDYCLDFAMQSPHVALSQWFVPESYPSYFDPQRGLSPSTSGPSPASVGSCSDCQSLPWSPAPSTPAYSPEMTRHDTMSYSMGGQTDIKWEKPHAHGPCVTLMDVQQYADAQPEVDAYEGEFHEEHPTGYAFHVQEVYESSPVEAEPVNGVFPEVTYVNNDIEHRVEPPKFKRRQTHDTESVTDTTYSPTKVKKRSNGKKRGPKSHARSNSHSSHHKDNCNFDRAFPCPFATYGCRSTFGTKNEWKRHINTQHMRLGYWRCHQCRHGERRPNDFNRKDLFIQHVRRMHPPPSSKPTTKATTKKSPNSRPPKNDPVEQALIATAAESFHTTRAAPSQSSCLFCGERFSGPGSWDDRLEHIGKHMESAKKDVDGPTSLKYWLRDEALEDYLMNEKIIVDTGDECTLADEKA